VELDGRLRDQVVDLAARDPLGERLGHVLGRPPRAVGWSPSRSAWPAGRPPSY
jgi:hypothetical protein